MHSPKKNGRDDKGRKRRQEKKRDERGWDASQDEPDRLLRCKQSKENANPCLDCEKTGIPSDEWWEGEGRHLYSAAGRGHM
jgi:hypothetical protein